MNLKTLWGMGLLAGLMLASGCSHLARLEKGIIEHPTPPTTIETAIDLATDYLVKACLDNGQFIYRVNSSYWFQNSSRNSHYNILRHAGTIMALAQAYQHRPRSEVRAVLLAAAGYLQSRIALLPNHPQLIGIWSLPEDSNGKHPPLIKLGGVGLGLVALVMVEQIVPGTTPLEDLRQLGRFLLHMQKPDGSFYSRFIPSQGGRSDRWTSLYYPGEAALGLLLLNDLIPSRRWVQAAALAVAHLIQNREVKSGDHWLPMAAAKLLTLPNHPDNIVTRRALLDYTRHYCEQILQEQILYGNDPKYAGGFSLDGRTTPTATRVEGLFAALAIIGDSDPALSNTVRHAIREAVDFLHRAQIPDGKYAGGMPRAVAAYGHDSQFNRRRREIRIDYVQHALSAMVQFAQIGDV